jgi:hypothetical protein
VGSVAYKLQLPATSTVHPVFHVSQLKGAVHVSQSAEPLPDSIDDMQVLLRILQKRVAKSGTTVRLQALIQWTGLPPSLSTWEDLEHLRQRFPQAPAWGQAGSDRGGDVSNVPSATGEDTGNTEDVAHANGDGPRRSVSECRPSTCV